MSYAYNETQMMVGIRAYRNKPPIAAATKKALLPPPRVSPIILKAAAAFSVTVPQLLSASREAPVLRAREGAALIFRRRFGYSYPKIGRLLRRHHTSIISSLQNAEKRYREDESFRNAVDIIHDARPSEDAPDETALAVFDPGRLADDLNADLPAALRELADAVERKEIDDLSASVEGADAGHWADTRAHILVRLHLASVIRKRIAATSEATC